ncbi:hypothetical protein N9W89_10860 [Hellea sp.]|nr:hypothetical protein [Hellea sp.]
MKRFKKRYIVYGLIALEIATIPVSAMIMQNVAFHAPQSVSAAPFPHEAGVSKFLLTSDAPFAVISENAIGKFDITIQASGDLNGLPFGDQAQMPGDAQSCTLSDTKDPKIIYLAERKTALSEGDALSRAVILEIRYPANVKPDFKIVTENESKGVKIAKLCTPKQS